MAAGSFYPSEHELQEWASDLGVSLDRASAKREQFRLRVSVQVFTKSIVAVLALSLGLAYAATTVTGRSFWVLYGAAVVLPLLGVGFYRPAFAAIWPRTAVRYYLTAVMDRLRVWSDDPSDSADYLRIIIPPLEAVLLGSALLAQLAGSRSARTALKSRLEAITRQLGEVELLLPDMAAPSAQARAHRLRGHLGLLLVAIDLRRLTGLPQRVLDPVDVGAVDAAERPTGWSSKALDKVRDMSVEWAVGALGAALFAVVVPIAQRSGVPLR